MLFVRFRSAISTSPVRVAQVGQEYSADEVELVAETKGNEVKVKCKRADDSQIPSALVSIMCNLKAKIELQNMERTGVKFKRVISDEPFGQAGKAAMALPNHLAQQIKLIQSFDIER